MENNHAVFQLVQHWPKIDSLIIWRQRSARRRALTILANDQVDNHGFPVPLGPKRLEGYWELEPGEAKATVRALRELEGLGVIESTWRQGSRPTSWSFVRDPRRWGDIELATSKVELHSFIFGCICGTVLEFADKFPDQAPHLRNTSLKMTNFRLDDHLRSGLLPVELLRYRDYRSANSRFTGGKPVELFRYRDGGEVDLETSPYIPSSINRTLLSKDEKESNFINHRLVRAAVDLCSGFPKFRESSGATRELSSKDASRDGTTTRWTTRSLKCRRSAQGRAPRGG